MKIIVHIDLNAFFVQCEILRDPSLRGKPVAVGYSGSRGVISTSSYEARAFGVFSGMPVSQAKRACPNLILVPDHFSLYRQYSNQFFTYLRVRYPILEKASIDECYIDMTDDIEPGKEEEYLFDLQMALYKATRLKCSIGCGANKFLAKMGSDYKKPLGLTLINQSNIQKILWPLPIEKMFGIGKQTAPKLKEAGINTIGDLALSDNPKVKSILGNLFLYYQGEANGIGDDHVDNSTFDPKSISAERTFSTDATSYEELSDMVRSCVQDIVAELQSYHKVALSISIKLRTPDFITKSKQMALSKPTDSYEEILSAAMGLFDRTYKDQPIRLLGIGIDKVEEKGKSEDKKTSSIQDSFLDEINKDLKEGGEVYKGKKDD